MRVGYGRGYYGEGQLIQHPTRRRGSGWIKLALVVGAGAVIWLMWPRRSSEVGPGSEPGGDEPRSPPPPPSPPEMQGAAQVPHALPAPQAPQPPDRGFPTQKAYEDAVVESARQLQATGAKVVMAPHLAHLAPRLES